MILRILPTGLAARAAKERLLEERPILLGPGPESLDWLMRTFQDWGGAAPAPGRVALAALAERVAAGLGLGREADNPGFLKALVELWAVWAKAGPDWRATAQRLKQADLQDLDRPGPAGPGLLDLLVRGFEAFQDRLAELGLRTEESRAWEAGRFCRAGEGGPDLLKGVARIALDQIEELSPAQADLLLALAQTGREVTIRRPVLDQGPDWPGLLVQDHLPGEGAPAELQGLIQAMAGLKKRPQEAGDRLVRFRAGGRYAELEEAGRRIRSLLDQGVSPRRIGLVCRTLAGLNGQMIEDVGRRYKIPLETRRGQPLLETGPVKALLAGLTLVGRGPGQGPTRENLLRVAESSYLDSLVDRRAGPGETVRALLRAGYLPGRSRAWQRPLRDLARRMKPKERTGVEAALADLERTVGLFQDLAREKDPAEALLGLSDLAGRLDLADPGLSPLTQRLERAALAELRSGLEALAADLDRLGPPGHRKGAGGSLLGLVLAALAESTVRTPGRNPGGVMVLRLEDVRGLRFDHLFLVGLVEGEWPAGPMADPFFDDRAKARLNQALGWELFRTTAAHYLRERFLFLQALAAARERLYLSGHAFDSGGRPKLSSSLWLWLERHLADPEEVEEVVVGRPPAWEVVLAEDELAARLSRDLAAGGEGAGLASAVAGELGPGSGWPARLAWTLDRVRTEREREAFLLNPDQDLNGRGPFLGRLASPLAAGSLKHWFAQEGRLDLPIAALEAYAGCPFSFLAQRIWGLAPGRVHGPHPDPLDMGLLVHDLLHRLLERALETGRYPPEAEDLAAVAPEVVQAWTRRDFRGHPALVKRQADEALAQVTAWLEWEEANAKEGWRPWLLEHNLPWLEVALGAGARVRVPSRADRVDRGPAGLRVVDYKSGGQFQQLQEKVRESLKTAFQLPVYLAALARETGEACPQAAFLLIREGKATQTLAWSPERTRELEERIRDLTQGMLAGLFEPRPESALDCDRRCGLKSLCRHETVPGQAGEDQ